MARKNAKTSNDKQPLTIIRDEELTSIAGGAMVSQVLKNIGSALNTVARGG